MRHALYIAVIFSLLGWIYFNNDDSSSLSFHVEGGGGALDAKIDGSTLPSTKAVESHSIEEPLIESSSAPLFFDGAADIGVGDHFEKLVDISPGDTIGDIPPQQQTETVVTHLPESITANIPKNYGSAKNHVVTPGFQDYISGVIMQLDNIDYETQMEILPRANEPMPEFFGRIEKTIGFEYFMMELDKFDHPQDEYLAPQPPEESDH